jgi:hypothetical protein
LKRKKTNRLHEERQPLFFFLIAKPLSRSRSIL